MYVGLTENEANKLRTACALKNFDEYGREVPVPHEVARDYLQIKRCYMRLSGTCDLDMLMAMAAAKHGYGEARGNEPWNAADEWYAKRLRYDDQVTVVWRGTARLARVKLCKGNKKTMRIQFEGDDVERDVPVKMILPAEPGLVAQQREAVSGNA